MGSAVQEQANGHAKAPRDGEVRHIPLSRIRSRREDQFGALNIRSDVELEGKRIEALATQIKDQGLLEPPIVEEVYDKGDSEPWYEVIAGNRRLAALRSMKAKGTVPCSVRAPKSAADRVLMNAAENTAHEDLHPADLACRFAQMEAGMYPGAREPGPEGRGPMPDAIPRSKIAEATGLSVSYIGNLSRAWTKLTPKLRDEWRKRRPPGPCFSPDLAVRWASLPPEKQQAAFDAWLSRQKAKKVAKGEKAEKKGAKGSKGGKGGGGDADEAGERPRKKAEVIAQLEKLDAKINGPKLGARELELVHARRDTLRWVIGDLKRLPTS